MEQDETNSIEEGELSNDSDNYTPLERPASYSAAAQEPPRFPPNLPSESEEEPESSESDSDSDCKFKKNKKPKIKLKPKARYQKPVRNKYDIWSTRVQEDVLAETLNSCDVTTRDRSRDVESYDYTLVNKLHNREPSEQFSETEISRGNKRTRDDRRNTNFRMQRKRSSSKEGLKGSKRVILDLKVNEHYSEDDVATDIANKLGEEKEDLILKAVNSLGKKKAIEIFEETKCIEGKGGMLIMNQTRRRTPGGVFLFLVRHDYSVSQEQKNEIFGEERQRNKQMAKQKQKDKSRRWKEEIAAAKAKLLPDLLTRAELLASQNPTRKIKEQTEETEVINPPPTPETDGGHDNDNSGDDMETPPHHPIVNGSDSAMDAVRGKPQAYDDDFLDIVGCSADMDLF